MLDSNTSKVTWVAVAVGVVAVLGIGGATLYPEALEAAKTQVVNTATSFAGGINAKAASAKNAEDTGFEFEINDDNPDTVTISGYKTYGDVQEEIVIPEYVKVEGKARKVTRIDSWSFNVPSDETKSTILKSVTIPDSVEVIDDYAFYGNAGLTTVKFGSNVKTIGDSAFSNTGVTSIDLPSSVKNIGSYAFWWAPLSNVYIPDSVDEIGVSAFYGYYDSPVKLENFNYDGTKTKFYNSVYNSETGLYDKTPSDSVYTVARISDVTKVTNRGIKDAPMLHESDMKFYWNSGSETVYVAGWIDDIRNKNKPEPTKLEIPPYVVMKDGIKHKVTKIGSWAFDEANITELVLPDTIDEIKWYAFDETKLTSVYIPDSVQVVGDSAFSIDWSVPNKKYTTVSYNSEKTTFETNLKTSIRDIVDGETVVTDRAK